MTIIFHILIIYSKKKKKKKNKIEFIIFHTPHFLLTEYGDSPIKMRVFWLLFGGNEYECFLWNVLSNYYLWIWVDGICYLLYV